MKIKHYYILFFLFLIFCLSANAQDTIYLDKKGKEVASPDLANSYRILVYEGLPKGIEVYETTFYKSGKQKSTRYFSNYKKRIRDGKQITWKEEGYKHIEAIYQNGKLHREFFTYWPNGQMKRKDIYKKGKLKEGAVWDEEGKEANYYPFLVKAQFPGGQKALNEFLKENINLKFQKDDRIVTRFVVDASGRIKDIEIIEGKFVDQKLEVFRVLDLMPLWSPGKIDGELSDFRYTLPISFK